MLPINIRKVNLVSNKKKYLFRLATASASLALVLFIFPGLIKQSLLNQSASAYTPDAFVMVVNTNNTASGGTNNLSFQIPTATTGTVYNYNVDCNDDGTPEATNLTGDYTCVYATPGTYTIAITGSFPRIHFGRWNYPYGDAKKLTDIKQWGTQVWQSMASAFQNTVNMTMTATDVPNLTAVTDMSNMFQYAYLFNQDISGWNVSNVTNMSSMFVDASAFNQDISSWDTSNVTDMSSMFWGASAFNQDISDWNTGNVTNMYRMFNDASSFNNGGVALDWVNTSKVTDMGVMFQYATVFNQDVSSWDTSNVVDMVEMFRDATAFNNGGVALDCVDTSNVTDMSYMFLYAPAFNQDISSWDTSNVTTMWGMFEDATSFNQDISSWDTSNVTDMDSMFYNASSFNQDISSWDVSSVKYLSDFLTGGRLSNTNYDKLLASWSAQNLIAGNADFGHSTYCDVAARSAFNAKVPITEDGGPSSACSVPAPVITSPTPNQVIQSPELTIIGNATPGQTVRIRVDDQTFDVLVDESGEFTQTITGLTTNPYSIIATILVDGIDESPPSVLAFTVTEPTEPTNPTTPTPPATGVGKTMSPIMPIVASLLVLVGIGIRIKLKPNKI